MDDGGTATGPEVTPERALGEVPRIARRERGLSQQQVAERAGYDPTYISILEHGHKSATVSALFRLALALEMAPSDLIRRAESQVTVLSDRRSDRSASHL